VGALFETVITASGRRATRGGLNDFAKDKVCGLIKAAEEPEGAPDETRQAKDQKDSAFSGGWGNKSQLHPSKWSFWPNNKYQLVDGGGSTRA